MTAPLGILGGTFDPVHFGHLRPALELLEGLELDTIRLIPCGTPPHRQMPVASAVQRLEMLHLAVDDTEGLVVDDRELQRGGPSYMVDTLTSLRNEVGEQPLCLILGLDAFLGLDSWHQWERIPELCHLVVAHRPGWSLHEQVSEPIQQLLNRRRTQDREGICREKQV